MKRRPVLYHALFFLALLVCPEKMRASSDSERDHVLRVCTGCHCLEFNVTPRSRKAWELTVANMRVFAENGAVPFTEAEADRVVDYMAAYFDDNSTLDPLKHFAKALEPAAAAPSPAPAVVPTVIEPQAHEAEKPTVATSVVPTPPAALRPPSSNIQPAIRVHLAHPDWKPSRTLKHMAEFGGYWALFCTLTLLASGHNRRRLGRRFRPLHIVAALGLFLGLATHAMIYLAQYGNPPVLWYWFGVASFLSLVLAQFQGLIRKRFGRLFLRIHVAAGYGGLTLAVFHWVWAWL